MKQDTQMPHGEAAARRKPALFPGSFNPFTLGHADIVRRALQLFGEVVIAVGCNGQKPGQAPASCRTENISRLYADEPRVRVVSYEGLTADLARRLEACAIVRGVRTMADFEHEVQMADVNRQLAGIETVLLPASPHLASLSSSMVRELEHFGHDVAPFLP